MMTDAPSCLPCPSDEATDADAREVLTLLQHQLEGVGARAIPSVTTPEFWPTSTEFKGASAPDPGTPGWHHLMPTPESEWSAERRQQQVMVKRLPRRLKKLVERARTTHLRGQLVDAVTAELSRRAAASDRLFKTSAADEPHDLIYRPRIYTAGIDVDRTLSKMARDNGFMLRLYKEARQGKKHARLFSLWVKGPVPVDLPSIALPWSGQGVFETSIGLTVAQLPHRPPEGLLVALAQHFWRARVRGGGGGEDGGGGTRRVLDWGAGNSPFARALVGTNPDFFAIEHEGDGDDVGTLISSKSQPEFEADEVDVLGEAPELAFVSRAFEIQKGRSYTFALVQLPPPCATRGGYRDRCKGPHAGREGQAGLRDLGRLGPKQWSKSAPRILRRVLKALRRSSQIAVVVPLFEVGGSGQNCREFLEMVSLVREVLSEGGLPVTHDFEVAASESSEKWHCLVASKGAAARRPAPAVDSSIGDARIADSRIADSSEDDGIEAFLQGID